MTSVLVIQTAFAGDLILTLPLIQEVKRSCRDAEVDVVCIPSTAPLLENHPGIRRVYPYDKRGKGKSIIRFASMLRSGSSYDICLSPHRSLRSALLASLSGARRRIGFNTSSARFLFTDKVPYDQHLHEIERNLDLLAPLGVRPKIPVSPRLFPSLEHKERISDVLARLHVDAPYVVLAPGSVWATKRWTKEAFAEVATHFSRRYAVFVIGGTEDAQLGETIASQRAGVFSVAGAWSFLETAELIRRAAVLISNDSAPVHLASAMGTPVVEIFGATSPAFGFTPYEVDHRIVELIGLDCRPCGIHGGDTCPLGTFVCMRNLPGSRVIEAAEQIGRWG